MIFDVIDVQSDVYLPYLSVHHLKLLYGFRSTEGLLEVEVLWMLTLNTISNFVDGLKAHVPQNCYLSKATFFLLRYFSCLLGDIFSIIQLM